ncbi:MAG: CPBP family intramembrane glutamic endopeptidase [Sedimentibacter sp.]
MKTIPTKDRISNYIFLLLLLGLIFLQIPFVILIVYNKIPVSISVGRNILYNGTYLITAFLIILKRDFLSDYNIDLFSLFILIIAPIAELLSKYLLIKVTITGSIQLNSFKIAISILLLLTLLLARPKLRKKSVKEVLLWLLIAVITGLCVGVLMGNVLSIQGGGRNSIYPSFYYFVGSFIIQLNRAAVTEEPLFRGLLWGFLKKANWRDSWICLFQAALFMLGHIRYLGENNYSFFIIVPVSALILGLLVWRSKSIGTTMITHGLINSVADIVAHLTW